MPKKNLFPFSEFLSIISTSPRRPNSLIARSLSNSAPNRRDSNEFCDHLNRTSAGWFSSMLQDFSTVRDLRKGRQVHAQIVANGLTDAGFLGTKILSMYVLCESFLDAKSVFSGIEKWHPSPWNWMIRGFTMMCCFELALLFYFKMLGCGVLPDKYTFPYVIKACSGLNAVNLGRLIHESMHLMGLDTNMFVGSSLIKLYAENDVIDDARSVFERMREKDSVLWNVMIDGYVENGNICEALRLFHVMRRTQTRPNSVTFSCVLSICASQGMIKYGTQLHSLAIRCGLELEASVANTLLSMYSKCRHLPDAQKLFDMMGHTDLVTWNGMIAGCVQNGFNAEALGLFYEMQLAGVKPDSITLSSFLPSFSDSACLKQGKEIHSYIFRNGVFLDAYLKSALIDVYFKCRDVNMAQKVFDRSGTVDVVICSAMISGFVLNGLNLDALEMFRWSLKEEIKLNAVTLACVLPACASLTTLSLGKELHCYILKSAFDSHCHVGSALIDMYAKCGRLDLSGHVFENVSERDSVLWNTMIVSCSQNARPEQAVCLFRKMASEQTSCDYVTISAALSACANIPSLIHGKEIHAFLLKGALRSDIFAESALIDMYAKCGDLVLARHVFDSMQEKNEVSWNSIIAAYGTHGLAKDALSLFREMKEEGIQPDHITFLAIISACGHAGLVDEGLKYFNFMVDKSGIAARMEHYACMVDLFGRSGLLHEALDFITRMPFKPDAGVWGALLGACCIHKNFELAELASKQLFELDPQNSGYYVLMSNIHAVAGRWDGVLHVRSLMKKRKVQKVPGCSWIKINSTTHMFISADKSHPQSEQIYLYLKNLILDLRQAGYVPQPALTYPLPVASNI